MTRRRSSERGSALIYILIAIALLAALTATFMDSSSQQTSSQNTFNAVTELNSQINFIRSAIQECVLTYSSGDTVQTAPPNPPYPLLPDSTYLLNPKSSGNIDVQFVRCPGNPGTSNDHAVIFGGSSGKFLPPPPNLFSNWKYYNGTDGVFFWTSTSFSDSYLTTALTKLDDNFSECEADIINNSASGSALNLLSSGTVAQCPANSYCFRVWMIAQPSNVYVGDTDTDEQACP